MSLRLRLVLWYMAVQALTLIGLGVLLRFRIEATLLNALDQELVLQSNRPLPRPPDRLLSNRPQGARRPQLAGGPGQAFFDASGKSLFNGPLAPDLDSVKTVVRTGKALAVSRNNQRLYTTLVRTRTSSQNPIVFQTTASLLPLQQQIATQTRELLLLLPFALLIAAGGGLFLTERALRPMRELTRAAEQIGAGELSQRLKVPGSDELARLTQSFNGILARLESAFGQLTGSLEQQKRFVADASHELKTPLTAIKINTELALDDPQLTDETRARLVRVHKSTDRTIRLVRNLLLLARGDADTLSLQCQSFDIALFLAEISQTATLLHPKGAAVVTQAETRTLYGDPDYLLQLLLNLLDNALRHTPATGSVTVTAHTDGFTVTDTGPGIAADHLAHLTERFYRVDTARAHKAGGAGLGLAIAQTIAEAHDGTLEIQSTLGKGTRVTVRLPNQKPPQTTQV